MEIEPFASHSQNGDIGVPELVRPIGPDTLNGRGFRYLNRSQSMRLLHRYDVGQQRIGDRSGVRYSVRARGVDVQQIPRHHLHGVLCGGTKAEYQE